MTSINYLSEEELQNLIYEIRDRLDLKVDIIAGKGLSVNDYTNYDKTKVAEIKNKADKTYVDTRFSEKQNNLIAGDNIDITNNTISATSTTVDISGKADKTYVDTELNQKANKTYVDTELDGKQNNLIAGDNIDITNNTISAISTTTDISGKADKTYVDNKIKTDVPENAEFTDTIYDDAEVIFKANDVSEQVEPLDPKYDIWVGLEKDRGISPNTLYFCYEEE